MKKTRYIITLIFIFLMSLAGDVTGNKAVIFPEISALLIGLICTDKLPWKTDGLHTIIMMTISAFAGYAIVNYLPLPMYFQSLVGFAFVGIMIILADCTMMPCISACLLPIYMGESSLTYPISVTAMTIAVVVIRGIMIHSGVKEASVKFRYLPDFEADLKLWWPIAVMFAVMAGYPLWSGNVFLLAPPLVMTFVESSCRNMSGRRLRIWFLVTVAAVIGALLRFIGVDLFGLPMCGIAVIASALVLLEMKLMNLFFPPVGAVVLLAFIANGDIFMYPPCIAIGCAIVLIVSTIYRNCRIKKECKHGQSYIQR